MKYSIGKSTYAYEISGEGSPIVLLHGFTASQQTWIRLREQLENQFLVITIDLPGHGNTLAPAKTMEQCCHDLAKLLTYLNIKRAHVVGYSMGGRVALSFALQYPDYVMSLVLESSSPGIQIKEEREARVTRDEDLAQKIEQNGISWFVDFWENIPLFATQKKLSKPTQQAIRKERLSQQKEGLARSLRYMGTGTQPSWWEKLTNIQIPVLLVVGEYDQKFVNINEKMASQMKRTKVVVVRDAGHAVHVEQPNFFGKLIMSFLLKKINNIQF